MEAGMAKVIEGLNHVMTKDLGVYIALETMAGKGSELGCSFEEPGSHLRRCEGKSVAEGVF